MNVDELMGITHVPGDFHRSKSGAPYVSSLTKTRKRKGNKADLIAVALSQGLTIPDKVTVDQLHELLGPESADEVYGRPSSFGKQIENTYNLQKWSERAIALGVFRDAAALAELAEVPADELNLQHPNTRRLLDRAAVAAKAAAEADLAAERGTHTHATTEDVDTETDWITRVERGENLGIPPEAQAALVAAWEKMLLIEGFEILAVEATVVDDVWRLAGTLDRIVRLTRDRSFVLSTGGIITLKAGTVVVLDLKTGKLRTGEDKHPDYWHGYSVQVASYAQSVPYDTATDTRREWGFTIDQQWAIIAHLDVLAALDGEAVCRLVLVDLEAGRHAGNLCAAAKAWEKRRDVFSQVTDADRVVVPVSPNETPAPVAAPPPDETEVGALLARIDAIKANDVAFKALLASWPQGVPTPKSAAKWCDDDLRQAIDAVMAVERDHSLPFLPEPVEPIMSTFATIETPERVDNEGPLDADDAERIIATMLTLGPAMAQANAWAAQARDAGGSLSITQLPSRRRRHIATAITAVCMRDYGDHDAVMRTFINLIMDGELQPTITTGAALGALTISEAERLETLTCS